MAKIDVLLPVRNGVQFLAESIDSVIAQTFRDWRLLILDHGSTDGSLALAQRYRLTDSRIEVHACAHAASLADLLNIGLERCNAPYMMRHDADDVCLPERMALTLAAFEADRHCIVIGGQAEVIDAAGISRGMMDLPVGRTWLQAHSLFSNPVAHPTAMPTIPCN